MFYVKQSIQNENYNTNNLKKNGYFNIGIDKFYGNSYDEH